MKIDKFIHDNKIGKLLINESLRKYNTYKVDSIASYIVYPKDINKLIILLDFIKKNNLKYKILGRGSNLIFVSKVCHLILIKLDEFDKLKVTDNVVLVSAGYSLSKIANDMTKRGLSGLEFACGIPGSVGGAVFMNAGAYNFDMGYIVESVKVLDDKLNVKTLYNKELDFHYRNSFFQHNPEYIILEAKLILKAGNKKTMLNIIEDRKRRRLMTQPLDYPSAGSVFRNPNNTPSGKIIEDAGLKGLSIGGAKVSEKHANFIINFDNATGEDIKNLIHEVRKKVKETFNIDLKVEQEIVTE